VHVEAVCLLPCFFGSKPAGVPQRSALTGVVRSSSVLQCRVRVVYSIDAIAARTRRIVTSADAPADPVKAANVIVIYVNLLSHILLHGHSLSKWRPRSRYFTIDSDVIKTIEAGHSIECITHAGDGRAAQSR